MRAVLGGAGALLALTVGGCATTVFLVGGAGAGQAASCGPAGGPVVLQASGPAAAGTATTGTPGVGAPPAGTTTSSAPAAAPAGPGGLPDRIGEFGPEQVRNAAQVLLAGRELGVDEHGQTVGVMTAIGESTLVNVDYGDKAGPDSRGIFQQRAAGWGTYEQRMDPRAAATSFFRALLQVPGWQGMAPTLAAHATQRNADPYHYERFWPQAVEVVSVLGGNPDLAAQLPPGGALACPVGPAGTAGTVTGPGGDFPAESCSVVPDPTTGRGCLTPRALNLARQLQVQGWRLSCWDEHAWNPSSDHPRGKACDIFPGAGGVLPNGQEKARGDALAASLQASAPQTGISLLIWYGRDWQPGRDWDGYGGGGVYDPSDVTGGHFDHIHASLYLLCPLVLPRRKGRTSCQAEKMTRRLWAERSARTGGRG